MALCTPHNHLKTRIRCQIHQPTHMQCLHASFYWQQTPRQTAKFHGDFSSCLKLDLRPLQCRKLAVCLFLASASSKPSHLGGACPKVMLTIPPTNASNPPSMIFHGIKQSLEWAFQDQNNLGPCSSDTSDYGCQAVVICCCNFRTIQPGRIECNRGTTAERFVISSWPQVLAKIKVQPRLGPQESLRPSKGLIQLLVKMTCLWKCRQTQNATISNSEDEGPSRHGDVPNPLLSGLGFSDGAGLRCKFGMKSRWRLMLAIRLSKWNESNTNTNAHTK